MANWHVVESEGRWRAETLIDNGSRYEVNADSEAALSELIAEAEARWDLPANPPRTEADEREMERNGWKQTAAILLSKLEDSEIVDVVNAGKDRRGYSRGV